MSSRELINCPGDDCNQLITLTNDRGYCPIHKMNITMLDEEEYIRRFPRPTPWETPAARQRTIPLPAASEKRWRR